MKALAVAIGGLVLAACQTVPADRGIDVIYVPTPYETVGAMLALGEVGPGDVVYDLGSGDGRIPIAAAKRYGARGVGIDISPQRIAEANANARAAGVTERVRFRRADLFQADFREATVVTLYLLPELNERLKPRLLALKPGTRIVSHSGTWATGSRRRPSTPPRASRSTFGGCRSGLAPPTSSFAYGETWMTDEGQSMNSARSSGPDTVTSRSVTRPLPRV